jgi:hypothetical protein
MEGSLIGRDVCRKPQLKINFAAYSLEKLETAFAMLN